MRDRETIDSELRLLAARRRLIREQGGEPSSRQVDELLDERLGHRADVSETEAVEAYKTAVVVDSWSRRDEANDITPYRRKGVLGRLGLLAALPLSLVAVATVSVVMFAVHDPQPAAPPTVVPPSAGRPTPAAPTPPAPPLKQAPPLGIVDRALIDTLKQEGVPVPSHERILNGPDNVDAHPSGTSPFGVMDMVGNVWQWTDEYIDEHTRAAILRGGSHYQPIGSIWYFPQAYRNDEHGKLLLMALSYDRSGTLGFRCVEDAQ